MNRDIYIATIKIKSKPQKRKKETISSEIITKAKTIEELSPLDLSYTAKRIFGRKDIREKTKNMINDYDIIELTLIRKVGVSNDLE